MYINLYFFYILGIGAHSPVGEVLPGVFLSETFLYVRGEIPQGTSVF